jgi:aryl-alcohol dehydrogenase-like predicted oxidoreductase
MAPLATRRLGHSGLEVSEIGLGCNNFGRRLDLAGTRRVLDAALEAGITFLDTADIYGGAGRSEELMGEVLRGRYDRTVLATKFGMDMGDGAQARGSAAYIRQAIEGSLRRLRTDHVDLYWYHEPDGVTPIEETLGALHELVRAGRVRAIGASNFDAEQLREADRLARENGLTPFTAVQNEYSLLHREPELEVLPACQELGIGFVPYFPLASGLLTGKYRRGAEAPAGARLSGRKQVASEEQWEQVEALTEFAGERGVPLTHVAIGALLAHPAVSSVIAGATRPEQIEANVAAASWRPSDADQAALGERLRAATRAS